MSAKGSVIMGLVTVLFMAMFWQISEHFRDVSFVGKIVISLVVFIIIQIAGRMLR